VHGVTQLILENVGNTAMSPVVEHVRVLTQRLVAAMMLNKQITVGPSTERYLVNNVRGGTINRLINTHVRLKTILISVLMRTIAAIPMEKVVHGVTQLMLEHAGNTAMSPIAAVHVRVVIQGHVAVAM